MGGGVQNQTRRERRSLKALLGEETTACFIDYVKRT